jgi:hypothetical protein
MLKKPIYKNKEISHFPLELLVRLGGEFKGRRRIRDSAREGLKEIKALFTTG